jgi:hypothetical protein
MKEYFDDSHSAGKINKEMMDHIIHEIMNFLRCGLGMKG